MISVATPTYGGRFKTTYLLRRLARAELARGVGVLREAGGRMERAPVSVGTPKSHLFFRSALDVAPFSPGQSPLHRSPTATGHGSVDD